MNPLASNHEAIILPKGYLSWTQLDTWTKSPDTYVKYYMANQPRPHTVEMAFGKRSAEARENGDQSEIPVELRFELPEFKFDTLVEGVRCIGAADAMKADFGEFREDKTGVIPWTAKRVQGHDQLVFYAMLTLYQVGAIPNRAHVLWLPTKKNKHIEPTGALWNRVDNPIIERTGEPVYFTREFDPLEIDRMRRKTIDTAIAISNRYKKYIIDTI